MKGVHLVGYENVTLQDAFQQDKNNTQCQYVYQPKDLQLLNTRAASMQLSFHLTANISDFLRIMLWQLQKIHPQINSQHLHGKRLNVRSGSHICYQTLDSSMTFPCTKN